MVQKFPVCHAYTSAATINAAMSNPIATMIVTFRIGHRGVDSIEPQSRAEQLAAHRTADRLALDNDVFVARRWWSRWFRRNLWANAKCPICGGPVVTGPTLGPGGTAAPQTREELIASCAEHGHPPYNDNTITYLEQQK
jgi:hypothetical protein